MVDSTIQTINTPPIQNPIDLSSSLTPPNSQQHMKPNKFITFLIGFLVLIIITISVAAAKMLLTEKSNNPVASTKQNNTEKIPMAAKEKELLYSTYYLDGTDLYGANSDGTKIQKLEENVEELESVSPDGMNYIFRQFVETDPEKRNIATEDPLLKTVLKNVNGKSLTFEALSVSELWSANSNLVIIGIIDNNRESFEQKIQLVDTNNFVASPFTFPEDQYASLSLLNNGHLLMRRNLPGSERTDKESVEILDYDSSTKSIKPITKVRIASPLGKLSFDNTKYAYSNTLNLEVLNLQTGITKEYTNYQSSNQYLVWNTSWSPSDNYLAFNVSGLEKKIGILNLTNNEITSVYDKDFINNDPDKDKTDYRISDLSPRGWLSADKIYIRSEANYNQGDFDTRKNVKHWIYDLNTKQLKLLPWLNNTAVEFTNNPD